MRALYVLLGSLSLVVGAIGVLVPLLPTTPFVLLAAWAYARGSRRFEHWLLHHPRFGPMISDWREHGAVPGRAKAVATAVILSSVALVCSLQVATHAKLAAGTTCTCVLVFLLTRPSSEAVRRSLSTEGP